MRFKQILCLAETARAADSAMREAASLAQKNNAAVNFLYVFPQPDTMSVLFPHQHERQIMDRPRSMGAGESLFKHVEKITGLTGERFGVLVETGSVESAVVAAAEELHADLVVISGAGSPERIVRAAPCTVLVAREYEGRGVLAATDLSDPTFPALRGGKMAARLSGQPLTALFSLNVPEITSLGPGAELGVYVFSESEIEEMRQSVRSQLTQAMYKVHARGQTLVEHGPPGDAILRAATRLKSDLIVVGSHGKGLLPRLLLGSVAETVTRHAACSVLVMKPNQAAAAQEAA